MKTLSQNDPEALREAVEALRDGGVIVLPTETVYGLACRWDDAAARERIYRLKRRPSNKLLQMLAADLPQAAAYGVTVTPELERLSAAFWPGPLTAVVPAVGAHPTIGLRLPEHPFVQALLREGGLALAATSANLSGEPPATTVLDATARLDGQPDLAVDGGAISVTGGRASTVVSLLAERPSLLREGTITLDDIQNALKERP